MNPCEGEGDSRPPRRPSSFSALRWDQEGLFRLPGGSGFGYRAHYLAAKHPNVPPNGTSHQTGPCKKVELPPRNPLPRLDVVKLRLPLSSTQRFFCPAFVDSDPCLHCQAHAEKYEPQPPRAESPPCAHRREGEALDGIFGAHPR